jgi:hypothetical protein
MSTTDHSWVALRRICSLSANILPTPEFPRLLANGTLNDLLQGREAWLNLALQEGGDELVRHLDSATSQGVEDNQWRSDRRGTIALQQTPSRRTFASKSAVRGGGRGTATVPESSKSATAIQSGGLAASNWNPQNFVTSSRGRGHGHGTERRAMASSIDRRVIKGGEREASKRKARINQ